MKRILLGVSGLCALQAALWWALSLRNENALLAAVLGVFLGECAVLCYETGALSHQNGSKTRAMKRALPLLGQWAALSAALGILGFALRNQRAAAWAVLGSAALLVSSVAVWALAAARSVFYHAE